MNSLQKATISVRGNDIQVSMPFAKVNKEKRLVSGFATLDNVDSQGDIVLAEASAKAFARGRGNLREMHDKVAVGRIVDFKEDEYFDKATGEFYKGVYVTAYISKGAPNTWEKVLDGTLTGFSIGGEILDADNEITKNGESNIRIIKDFDLTELSLVDNPANGLANVDSIQKNLFKIDKAAGSVTGIITETEIENVFTCEADGLFQTKAEKVSTCPECGESMKAIGWFENTGEGRAEKVKEVVKKFLRIGEGGVEMTKKDKANESEDETVQTGHEAGDPTEVPTPAEPAQSVPEDTGAEDAENVDETAGTDEVEKAETVDEVEDDQDEILKKVSELHALVEAGIAKASEDTDKKVDALASKIDEVNTAILTKVSELEDRLSGYDDKLEATKTRLAGFEKSLEKFNSAGAFRKSADLNESEEKVQKDNTWNGAFSLDNMLR